MDGWKELGAALGEEVLFWERKSISLFSEVVGEIFWRCEVLLCGGCSWWYHTVIVL